VKVWQEAETKQGAKQEAEAKQVARPTGSGRATRRMKLRREDRLNEREDKMQVRREAK